MVNHLRRDLDAVLAGLLLLAVLPMTSCSTFSSKKEATAKAPGTAPPQALAEASAVTQSEWMEVQTRLDDQQRNLETLKAGLAAIEKHLQKELGSTSVQKPPTQAPPVMQVPTQESAPPVPSLVTAPKTEAPPTTTIADSSNENMHFYYSGVQSLKSSEYDKSAQLMSQFIALHPNHVYADRARFLVAEAHLRGGQYQKVLEQTQEFETNYPYSFKLADVLFQRAVSFSALGKATEAMASYEALVRRFPDDPLATEASQRMQQLNES